MYNTPSHGKGDKPRPLSISYTKYRNNWDDIFSKKTATTSDNKDIASQGKNKESPTPDYSTV